LPPRWLRRASGKASRQKPHGVCGDLVSDFLR
jgi:hypothetical protein